MRDKWITNPTWTLFYIYTGAGCYSNPILFINTIYGSTRKLLGHTLLHSSLSVLLSAQNRHGPTSCPACHSSWVISLWSWLQLMWTSFWAQDCRHGIGRLCTRADYLERYKQEIQKENTSLTNIKEWLSDEPGTRTENSVLSLITLIQAVLQVIFTLSRSKSERVWQSMKILSLMSCS